MACGSCSCVRCSGGLLGCRWAAEKRTSSIWCGRVWMGIFGLALLFVGFWLYFWILMWNDRAYVNWYLGDETGLFIAFYAIVISFTAVTSLYIIMLLVLYLCRVGHRKSLYLSIFHRILLVVIVVMCSISCWLINWLYSDGWALMLLSYKITGPFLHVCLVTVFTFLGWFVLSYSLNISNNVARVTWIVVYVAVMLVVYLAPLLINSPCVVESNMLPAKPKLVAHKGVSAMFPENTVMSMEGASRLSDDMITLESDIIVSYDGVPFLFYDPKWLKRTTNVDVVFPSLSHLPPCMFNFSQLQQLDAGSWFLQMDPFRTVKHRTPAERDAIAQQKIPRLTDLLDIAEDHGKNVMFDVVYGCGDSHPYATMYTEVILDAINQHSINPSQIWWLGGQSNKTVGFTRIGNSPASPDELRRQGKHRLNLGYRTLSVQQLQSYEEANISTNIYLVNSDWLYSLYWCTGVTSVTTDTSHRFALLTSPVWHLLPIQFYAIWITVDVLSFLLLTTFMLIILCRKRRTERKMDITPLD